MTLFKKILKWTGIVVGRIFIILVIVRAFHFYNLDKTNAQVAKIHATDLYVSNTINIKNFSFNPSILITKIGEKITWVNNDNISHTITSDLKGSFDSGTLISGQSFSFTLTKTGSTKYHCSIHPTMTGEIIVPN